MPRTDRRAFTRIELPIRSRSAAGLLLALLLAPAGAIPAGRDGRGPAPAPEPIEVRGIENAFRASPRLYSGGEPRGDEAFAALRALGIRTVISVDGAAPDLDSARRHGIRYVHLPIGYDGVPREQAVRIVRAARSLPGPVFVHCHHGKHRGPAAVAVCGLANEGWTAAQAVAWLGRAGTAPEYRGLYRSAESFAPPTPAELEAAGDAFPERAEVPAFVETMVRVDGHWDRLKAVRMAGFRAPADHPDVDPPHEALMLTESFREAARLDEVRARGPDFLRQLSTAERDAEALARTLRAHAEAPGEGTRRPAEAALDAVSRGCTGCHARYRDN